MSYVYLNGIRKGRKCAALKAPKKKNVLRRCEPNDADGIRGNGNNGGDAFDTDSQHVYNLQIYYTKLIHSKVYYCSRGFFAISFHFIMIMVCTCEKRDRCTDSVPEQFIKVQVAVCVCHGMRCDV